MAASQSIVSPIGQEQTTPDQLFDTTQEFANYKRLIERAADAFGDEIKASFWLSTPNAALGGETPLQSAQKDGYSGDSLEPLLMRIEHGIYY